MMKVYYAHSVGIYGSKQEARDINTLKFLGFEVVNPNTPEIQREIELYKLKHPDTLMTYFDNILDNCDALAFRAHADGQIGSGVAYELDYINKQYKPIIELPTIYSKRILSYEETSQWLKYSGNR